MLAVVAFVVALGFGVVAPAIPLFARSYGVGTAAVGLAVSAFAFFRFVSAFAGGALVERAGERTVLTAGLVIVALTTGSAGLAAAMGMADWASHRLEVRTLQELHAGEGAPHDPERVDQLRLPL